MQATNEMIIIAGSNNNDLCYLLIILVAIFLVYILTSIEIKRSRVSKLKEAEKLIREGHNRKTLGKE